MTPEQIKEAALRSGIAHNNGAGGQYLLCATEEQLLSFARTLAAPGEAPSASQGDLAEGDEVAA